MRFYIYPPALSAGWSPDAPDRGGCRADTDGPGRARAGHAGVAEPTRAGPYLFRAPAVWYVAPSHSKISIPFLDSERKD